MIGTQRATKARSHGPGEGPDVPLLDAVTFTEFDPEFFVEWQVADDLAASPAIGRPEK